MFSVRYPTVAPRTGPFAVWTSRLAEGKLLDMPYLPLLLFAAIYGFAALSWKLPPLVGLAYLAGSLGCF